MTALIKCRICLEKMHDMVMHQHPLTYLSIPDYAILCLPLPMFALSPKYPVRSFMYSHSSLKASPNDFNTIP